MLNVSCQKNYLSLAVEIRPPRIRNGLSCYVNCSNKQLVNQRWQVIIRRIQIMMFCRELEANVLW